MLRISFINVGYGDSILVEELHGSRRTFSMLVDGGPPYAGTYCASYDLRPARMPAFRYLQFHGIQSLDVLFLSHFHIDHVGGMPAVMKACACGQVWSNYRLPDPACLEDLNRVRIESRTAAEMRLSLNLLAEMQRMAEADGKEIEVLGEQQKTIALTGQLQADFFAIDPALAGRTEILAQAALNTADTAKAQRALVRLDGIQNAAGVALRLRYEGVRILLPADLPHSYWRSYLKEPDSLRADLLKIAHHGQADSMTEELAAAIRPRHAIVSVSSDNPLGAPAPEVFAMFDPEVQLWATENIEVQPYFPRAEPHRAVSFGIFPDGTIVAAPELL